MLQPGLWGTSRAFLPHSLATVPLSGSVRPEAERAQLLQFITICDKKTSLQEDQKQEHTAAGDCYKHTGSRALSNPCSMVPSLDCVHPFHWGEGMQ